MGMVLCARRLSDEDLRAVTADPESAIDLLVPEEDDEADALLGDGRLIDIDKSWHGIHWLLTGTQWSWSDAAGAAVLGGTEIGSDNGYGPARLLTAVEVAQVSAGLAAIDRATLAARYDPAAMAAAEIYPELIWVEGEDDYLLDYYDELRAFYAAAAKEGSAVLLTIT